MTKPQAKGREIALWAMYAADITRMTPKRALEQTRAIAESIDAEASDAWGHVTARLEGLDAQLERVDESLEEASEHWRFERMAVVDRNILRVGIYELLEMEEVPPLATIDSCVELAKTYGGESTPGFVNGLLDRVRGELEIEQPEPTS
jgi:N utilization substance protein B